jgi:hypothetical protein
MKNVMIRVFMRSVLCLSMLGFSGCQLPFPLWPVQTSGPTHFVDLTTSELQCLIFPEDQNEHVIRSAEQYAALFQVPQQLLDTPECQTLTGQPPVNLREYSIVGVLAQGGGCGARFERIIRRDDANRQLLYHVVMQSFGLCDMLISNRNWLAVPRIPEAYELQFQVDHEPWESADPPISELELQLEIEPTFALPRWMVDFGRVPPLSLYSDGTVVYLHSVSDSLEQHVRTVKLTPTEKQALLDRVQHLGFDRLASRNPKPAEPVIADAPYTVLHMERGAALKEVRIYYEYVNDEQAWQSILDFLYRYDHPSAEAYRPANATLFVRKLTNEEAAQYSTVRLNSWPYHSRYLRPHHPSQLYEWAWIFRGAELAQHWQENGSFFPQPLLYAGSGGLYEIEVVPWLPDDSFPEEIIHSYPNVQLR